MAEIEIKTLSASPNISEALGTMSTDVVANGGSCSARGGRRLSRRHRVALARPSAEPAAPRRNTA